MGAVGGGAKGASLKNPNTAIEDWMPYRNDHSIYIGFPGDCMFMDSRIDFFAAIGKRGDSEYLAALSYKQMKADYFAVGLGFGLIVTFTCTDAEPCV